MISEEQVRDALRNVLDPELGINVVDLGLVYGIGIDGERVRVELTMTSPACPLHAYLTDLASTAIRERLPEVTAVDVDLVWEPQWDPSMMSEEAKRQLGW